MADSGLATRHDLRLGLHRLRLEGELTEIRAADLRFTVDEARAILPIAANAELRRRHPDQKIEPLRSAEPGPATDTERDGKLADTGAWIRDLAAQHHAFREKLNERRHPMMSGDDLHWAALSGTLPSGWAPRRDAILRPPSQASRLQNRMPPTTSRTAV